MNILLHVDPSAVLECAVFLIAGVLFLDFRRSQRRRRLLLSMETTLQAATGLAIQEEMHSKAA